LPEVPAALVLELDLGDVVPVLIGTRLESVKLYTDDDAVGSKEPVAVGIVPLPVPVGKVPLPVPVGPPNPVLKEYG